MRTHRREPAFSLWQEPELLQSLVRDDRLIAARIENVAGRSAIALDLTFFDGDRACVVPFIEAEWTMLDEIEYSPFMWPHGVARYLWHETAAAIEARISPWVRSLYFSRAFNGERLRLFDSGQGGALVETARRLGFLGASPYRDVVLDMSPYAYAVRVAQGRTVAIRDPRGAAGAVLVARHAACVTADLGDADANRCAGLWFGRKIFDEAPIKSDISICRGAEPDADAAVRIRIGDCRQGAIEVPTPVPSEVMLSFDAQDSPPIPLFTFESAISRKQRHAFSVDESGAGGSAGRIVMLMREDWRVNPDADSENAQALAAALQVEGFTVRFAAPGEADVLAEADLVHAYTYAGSALRALETARASGKPISLTPLLYGGRIESAWGEALAISLARLASDEVTLEDYLVALGQRKIQGDEAPLPGSSPLPEDADLRAALGLCGAVIAAGPAEEQLIRGAGFTGEIVHAPALLRSPAPAAPVEQLAGTWDFVLVHAPIHRRSNQLLLLRAAAELDLPLVLAGPVQDAEYYRILRELSSERVIFAPEPDPSQRSGLYHTARVFADCGWDRRGLHRAAEAAASGCALVLSHGGDAAWGGVVNADPADQSSIRRALKLAWDMPGAEREAAARTALSSCASRSALVATVRAYTAAQERSRLNFSGA